MTFLFKASTRTVQFIILWTLVACPSNGNDGVVGVARLSGPLQSCSVEATNNSAILGNSITDSNGSFNVSIGPGVDGAVRVAVRPGAECFDVFTNFKLSFILSGALIPGAAEGSLGYGSFTGLSYLEQISSEANAGTRILRNVSTIRQSLQDLYGTFNISLANYQLDPLMLQPLTLLQSTNTTKRSLAVALLAADVAMGALTVLGAALLGASSSGAANASSVTNMTLFARTVAAEGARRLLQQAAERQARTAEEVIQNSNTTSGYSSGAPPAPPRLLPSPPSPPPSPSSSVVGGLYTSDLVVSILGSAAEQTGMTVPSYAINATAAVIAGMSAYTEVVKASALLAASGVSLGLNPLNALITLNRLAVVQADAATQMAGLLGPNPQALQNYVLDALPERLSQSSVNITAIHLALGLTPPMAPVAAYGVGHIVGPLVECMGQAGGVWDPSYEAFVTSGAGKLTLASKGQGFVTVTPYRSCRDGITQLQLNLSVSNLGPAMSTVSVSPVAMLAQGFYTLQASQRLQTISMSQQTAAFRAMGLDLDAYNALMFPPSMTSIRAAPSPTNILVPSSSYQPPPLGWSLPPAPAPLPVNESTASSFNLTVPLSAAVMAANVQLIGLIYASRAMFAMSCYHAYTVGSMESANTFTVTLTLYGLVLQVANGSGLLNLTSTRQLQEVFTFVATSCYFNSSLLAESPALEGSDVLELPSSTGTFLSGGSASAIGATADTSGRRRSSMTLWPDVSASADTTQIAPTAADAAAATLSPWRALSLSPAVHRQLLADLFTRGVTGPEPLLYHRLADLAARLQGEWDAWPGRGAAAPPKAEEGEDEGEGGDSEDGERLQQSLLRPHAMARRLSVYVDDLDMSTVYGKVAEVLAGINSKLKAIQTRSQAAADAATSGLVSVSFNITDMLITAAQLGYVVQKSFYEELYEAMMASYNSGMDLVIELQGIASRYTGAALQQRMAEAPINWALICTLDGADECSSGPSPEGGSSSSGGGKSNTALYVGVGAGVGLGVVALLLAAWAVRRAVRSRQVTKAIVHNFQTGNMHNMAMRLPSAVPLDGKQYGGGTLRQGQPSLDIYQSLVPAALGSNPSVAQDYPLYPLPASASAYQHYNSSNMALDSTNSYSGARNEGGQSPPAVSTGLIPNISLPPPPPPGGDRGSHGSQTSSTAPLMSSSSMPAQQRYMQRPRSESYMEVPPLPPPRPANVNAGALTYKTYANYAFVGTADGGSLSGADATALHENFHGKLGSGGASGGYVTQRWNGQDALQQHLRPSDDATGPALVPPLGGHGQVASNAMVAAAGPPSPGLPSKFSDGTSGAGGGSGGVLNTTAGRRQSLPPLAPYTSVTNSAAPTAALNASLRTIPVNMNFNSSLRPPAPHSGSSMLSGRQT